MAERDEFDERAERLLTWEFFSEETCDEIAWEKKITEIAAALRAAGKRSEAYHPMTESEQVKRLLTCEWFTDHGVTEDCEYADRDDICHVCACRPAVRRELEVRDTQISQLLETNDKWVIEIEGLRREVDQLKRALRKEVGYKVDHCVCILDDNDEAIAECDLHRGMRLEVDRLRSLKKTLNDAWYQASGEVAALKAKLDEIEKVENEPKRLYRRL